jgi:site-specific recombinase XerD
MASTAIALIEPARYSEHNHLRNAMQSLVLDGLSSPHTRRAYEQALEEFLIWLCADPARHFTKAAVQRYRTELQAKGLAPASVNVLISAIRRLALEASDNGLLAPEIAAGIGRVKGAKHSGVRLGRWLTREQAEELLRVPDHSTVQGIRDSAILAVLLGSGLRRDEAASLGFEHLQQRDERWVIADLVGKHGRIRTVPIPDWVDAAIRRWADAVALTTGRVFRALDKRGRVCSQRLSAQSVFNILKTHAAKTAVPVTPHDMRRTYAHLAHKGHAPLEQIQISLGHASIVTTELYLGVRQDLRDAPCDHLGIAP